MSSLDQIPFRKGEFGKMNASQMDLGLNISVWIFVRSVTGLDDQLLSYLSSMPNNLTPFPSTS